MTKKNIEDTIRDFLNNHLDLIPQLQNDDIFDVGINQINMITPFEYKGRGEYYFGGNGEGWIPTTDGGKSIRRFKILLSSVFISEGDDSPVVESVTNPIIIDMAP